MGSACIFRQPSDDVCMTKNDLNTRHVPGLRAIELMGVRSIRRGHGLTVDVRLYDRNMRGRRRSGGLGLLAYEGVRIEVNILGIYSAPQRICLDVTVNGRNVSRDLDQGEVLVLEEMSVATVEQAGWVESTRTLERSVASKKLSAGRRAITSALSGVQLEGGWF